jgi:hypothetical protein
VRLVREFSYLALDPEAGHCSGIWLPYENNSAFSCLMLFPIKREAYLFYQMVISFWGGTEI